jgi:hypothetical protein
MDKRLRPPVQPKSPRAAFRSKGFRVRSFPSDWAISGLVPGGINWPGLEFGRCHCFRSFGPEPEVNSARF